MKSKQKWVCNIADLSSPKPKDSIRILCFSDTHRHHNNIPKEWLPEADIVLIGGDFSETGSYSDTISFKNFVKSLPCEHKVIIAGNHEITYDPSNREDSIWHYLYYEGNDYHKVINKYKKLNGNCARNQPGKDYNDDAINFIKKQITDDNDIIYLEESSVNIEGINIYGSPYSLEYHQWAFQTPRADQPDCGLSESRWNQIPENTDIVLVHGPPFNILDKMIDNEHEGCPFLAERIKKMHHHYACLDIFMKIMVLKRLMIQYMQMFHYVTMITRLKTSHYCLILCLIKKNQFEILRFFFLILSEKYLLDFNKVQLD